MQAVSEKTVPFRKKHSGLATAMNKISCSIPIARSMQKRRWFVKNQRLYLYSGPTFGPTWSI
jgi:hypothetical protein